MPTITGPAATVTVTPATPTTWWLTDPVTENLSIPLNVTGHPTVVHEQLTSHYPLGTQYPTIVTDVVNGNDGQLQVETTGAAEFATLQTRLSDQRIKWLMSPFGDGLYIRIGGAAPSMGISGQVKQSQLTPGATATSPFRKITIQYVQVARP